MLVIIFVMSYKVFITVKVVHTLVQFTCHTEMLNLLYFTILQMEVR